jgi:hypothetical protein
MFPLKRFLILLALLSVHLAARAEDTLAGADYQPGKGWQIPGTGFRLGGYASAGMENDRHQHTNLGLDDFSLFVHWESDGKLRLFSELDLENPVLWEQSRGLTTHHAYLALERLYADYLYSEKLNFRAGKFLTPIGRWNVIHAAPLVWTTSRPLITEHAFPTNATGAMAYGTLPVMGREIDYSVYTAIGNDWRPDPKLDPFEEAYGLHLTMPTSNLGEFGVSYANFEQKGKIGERKNLLGMDYFWSRNRYEISAEMVYRLSDEGRHSDEKGLYIQGVAPIADRWYAIGRYELYDKAGPAPAMNLWLAGLAMRLSPAMVFKAEVSHASHNRIQAPEGVFASFAIMF